MPFRILEIMNLQGAFIWSLGKESCLFFVFVSVSDETPHSSFEEILPFLRRTTASLVAWNLLNQKQVAALARYLVLRIPGDVT